MFFGKSLLEQCQTMQQSHHDEISLSDQCSSVLRAALHIGQAGARK